MLKIVIYRKKLVFAAALGVAALMLAFPDAAASGAQRAMRVWYSSVAPSLFPFLVLMPILTGREACAAYDFLFGRIMRPLFRLPGTAASAMIVGMLSGSPGGAIAVRRIAAQGGLSPSEAHRLALAVCGVSPAFLIFGVGGSMLGSESAGFRLAGIQFAVQLILLFALRRVQFDCVEIPPQAEREFSPVRGAVETILVICGYMTFFSSICQVISRIHPMLGNALLVLADLPSGLQILTKLRYNCETILFSAEIGFGGLCIGVQNLDALRPIGVYAGEYFALRGCAAILSACLCAALNGVKIHSNGLICENPLVTSILLSLILAIPVWIFFAAQYSFNIRKSGISDEKT